MQDVFTKQLLKTLCAPHWKKIGLNAHHGIVMMLSSLHSKTSPLCGEFLDLIPMISWCEQVGCDFLQLLPVNDTGFDNSPYNPISTLALNPVYLSLHALPYYSTHSSLKEIISSMKKQSPSSPFNYTKARQAKFKFLEKYFELCFSQVEKSKEYLLFKEQNEWATAYALFCTLTEIYKLDDWRLWPKNLHTLQASQRSDLILKHQKRIDFHLMIQSFCFSQFAQVKKHADQNNVFLFGDLPFLVSKKSCDAWHFPQLFLMDYSVGSPPDNFTPEGQNWNFPAYNWAYLKKSDYHWWKTRLKIAENFYHIYRLDHIIGFFRTWNIPVGKKGCSGSFVPHDAALWLQQGYDFLSVLIQNSQMLPIGEDLVVPQTIKDVLRELGICGTNILTWQRTGAGGTDFVPYPLYNTASITHIASHDTVTLRQWWKKYSKAAKLFCLWKGWRYTPSLGNFKRKEILKDSHRTSSLFHANLLQEYLALFPEMIHKDYNKERINYPGTPSKRNWRYRFVPSVEQIVNSRKLREAILSITHLS